MGYWDYLRDLIQIKYLIDLTCKLAYLVRAPIIKADDYPISQNPKTKTEKETMKVYLYAQICTHPNSAPCNYCT